MRYKYYNKIIALILRFYSISILRGIKTLRCTGICNFKLKTSKISYIFIFFISQFLNSFSVYAGGEFQDWQVQPNIGEFYFTQESVTLIEKSLWWHQLDTPSQLWNITRKSYHLEKNQNNAIPTDLKYVIPRVMVSLNGISTSWSLIASDGQKYQVDDAYCSEGLKLHHSFKLNGALIKSFAKPCSNITAIEHTDKYILIGTAYGGEAGYEGVADGIIVLDRNDHKFVKRISLSDGLAGGIIRGIRKDPYTNHIWVGTELGLNELSPSLELLWSKYFYKGFNQTTPHEPMYFLIDSDQSSDPLAVLSEELGVTDHNRYYDLIMSLTEEDRKSLSLYSIFMGSFMYGKVPNLIVVLEPILKISADTANQSRAELAKKMLSRIENKNQK